MEDEEAASAVSRLPQALLVSVFLGTDGVSVARAACVCRAWAEAANDEWLWQRLVDQQWGTNSFPQPFPTWRVAYAERYSVPGAGGALVQEARWPLRKRAAHAALAQLERAHPRHALEFLETLLDTTNDYGEKADVLPCLSALCVDVFARVGAASAPAAGTAEEAALLLDAACALDRLVHSSTTVSSSCLRAHVAALGAAFRTCLTSLGLDAPDADPLARIRALNHFMFGPPEGEARAGSISLGREATLETIFGEACLAGAKAGRGGLGLGFPAHETFASPANSTLLNLFLTRKALPIVLVILQLSVGASAGVHLCIANSPQRVMARTPPGLCSPPIFFDFLIEFGRDLTAAQAAVALGLHDEPDIAAWRTQPSPPRDMAARMLRNVTNRPDGVPIPSISILSANIALLALTNPILALGLRLTRMQLALEAEDVHIAEEDMAGLMAFNPPEDSNVFRVVQEAEARSAVLKAKLQAQEARGEEPITTLEMYSLQGKWARGVFM
jgi:F-box-like/Transglutaminase-like superfamily